MQGGDQGLVHLQQGLSPGQHHHAVLAVAGRPLGQDAFGQGVGRGELAAQRAVGAHEVGIAELADGAGAVLLAAGPEVAACKAAEYGRRAGLAALALQGVEDFFDAVSHGAWRPVEPACRCARACIRAR